MKKPLVLCILDGWGEGPKNENNAIHMAKTPCFDRLSRRYPKAFLTTHGQAVGLPEGQMGNSEVGHLTIGSGRVIQQDLIRIQQALEDPNFLENPVFTDYVATLKRTKGVCHLLGLVSDGGVHSHSDHLLELIRHLVNKQIPIKIHAFLDGRDTGPKDALSHLMTFQKTLQTICGSIPCEIASVGGRYFGMDRDQRFERIDKAVESIAHGNSQGKDHEKNQGKSNTFKDPLEVIQHSYANGITDEFIEPCYQESYEGFQSNDGLIAFNFRADRMRQILTKLAESFPLACRLGFVSYSDDLDNDYPVLFPKTNVQNTLGEVFEKAGLAQYRVAETEKYAHVTYFLNGGRELAFQNEKRHMIPSPKVKTYDMKPEMSAFDVTQSVVQAIDSGQFDVIVVNYANPDMVGHTGDFQATVKAVETVDQCLQKLCDALLGESPDKPENGLLLVTADHGNAEEMFDTKSLNPITSHSTNLVPFILCQRALSTLNTSALKPKGSLADIAPTILDLLSLEKPSEMTGESLVIRQKSSRLSISLS